MCVCEREGEDRREAAGRSATASPGPTNPKPVVEEEDEDDVASTCVRRLRSARPAEAPADPLAGDGARRGVERRREQATLGLARLVHGTAVYCRTRDAMGHAHATPHGQHTHADTGIRIAHRPSATRARSRLGPGPSRQRCNARARGVRAAALATRNLKSELKGSRSSLKRTHAPRPVPSSSTCPFYTN